MHASRPIYICHNMKRSLEDGSVTQSIIRREDNHGNKTDCATHIVFGIFVAPGLHKKTHTVSVAFLSGNN